MEAIVYLPAPRPGTPSELNPNHACRRLYFDDSDGRHLESLAHRYDTGAHQ